ncbi:hypothetical protein SpCBS45565_g00557 [Spizellomyces sp. 'palustris']|nr:hypothetical protein SpCBS45565_g00557 [Spizellomyces sp. 'palustris']
MPAGLSATQNTTGVASSTSRSFSPTRKFSTSAEPFGTSFPSPSPSRKFSDVEDAGSATVRALRASMPSSPTIAFRRVSEGLPLSVASSPSSALSSALAASAPKPDHSGMGMGISSAGQLGLRKVYPVDSEPLSTSQGPLQAPSEDFLARIVAGSPGVISARASQRSNDAMCLRERIPSHSSVDSSASTPPVPIPFLGEGMHSHRSSSSSNVSPASSCRNLHRYRSDTNISRSHNTPRTLRKSRHARSMSFHHSDDEDDLHWRGFRDSPPSLPLVPYKNQVGGHASFLRFSDKAICKPLNARERDFYEVVESTHPEIKPFMANYLGVVNVTYSTASADTDYYGVAAGTPVVILEENKHILLDDHHDNPESMNTSEESVNSIPPYSKKLQQQVFKDALSPQSLRARFAQLKTAIGAMQRRHSITGAERPEADDAVKQSGLKCQQGPWYSMDSVAHDSSPSDAAISIPPSSKNLETSDTPSDSLAPIFQMSDDEEDKAPDARPKRDSSNPRHPTPPTRLTRSPSTPIRCITSEYHDEGANASDADQVPASVTYNPWSLHLYHAAMSKLSECDKGERRTHQFLLLEDLTQGLRFPCILDLKMGSRQHGVYATPEKRMSQEKKCEKSTSKKLGVRICGMQVYKVNTGTFTYLDKYIGRQINMSNFKQSLLSFLDNGEKYLVGYIPKMLERLKDLHRVVSKMPSYRFYASSLLILYDGAWAQDCGGQDRTSVQLSPSSDDEGRDPTPREVNMKMIDFANCVANAQTLRRLDDPETVTDDGHRTHPVPLPPTTKGPDNGYMLGLRTLIRSFEELYRELGGGGSHVDGNGHVSKNALTASQRMNVGGFTESSDLLSPSPLLLAGSAPTAGANPDVRGHNAPFVVMRYKDGTSTGALEATTKEEQGEGVGHASSLPLG